MDRKILFEDDNIVAVWQSGLSDYLLITFGDLISLASGTRFFADTPATKLNLNCLGFMAKKPNWFPKSSLIAAMNSIREWLSLFDTRINYGGSMGGYAAIKYSGLLGASKIIAFCPQWSIDPTECAGNRNGYETYFRSEMSGMGIRGEEISGRAYIFYDPSHSVDAFHYNRIAALGENITPIHVHMADHGVTTILAGSTVLSEIIAACRTDDHMRIYSITNRVRRKSNIRNRILFSRAIHKHPKLVMNASGALLSEDPPRSENDEVKVSLIKHFLNHGKSALARSAIRCLSDEFCGIQTRLLNDAIDDWEYGQAIASNILLLTAHDTILAYNAIDRRLAHQKSDVVLARRSGFHPVFLTNYQDEETLAIWHQGSVIPCTVGPRNYISFVEPKTPAEKNHIVTVAGLGDAIALKLRERYIWPDRQGRVHFDSTAIREWERFTRHTSTSGFKFLPN